MTPLEELTEKIANYESLINRGFYTRKMHEELDSLATQIREQVKQVNDAAAMLNAEITVAQAEIKNLEDQRTATRLYLGVALSVEDPEAPDGDAATTVARIIRDIMQQYPDKKIQQIKEVRSNNQLVKAWIILGGNPTGGVSTGGAYFGLKEAKDIIDEAWYGRLTLPNGGVIST